MKLKKTLMSTEMSGQIYIKTLYAQNNIFKKGIPNMRFLLLANHGELQIVNYKQWLFKALDIFKLIP